MSPPVHPLPAGFYRRRRKLAPSRWLFKQLQDRQQPGDAKKAARCNARAVFFVGPDLRRCLILSRGTLMIRRDCSYSQRREIMASTKLASLIVALVTAAALPALAQGGGGGAGGGAGGAASGAGGGSSAGSAASGAGGAAVGGSTSGAANSGSANGGTANGGTTGNSKINSQTPTPAAAPAGSRTAAQANRNAGAGTAPNGLPIGSPGSGVGSPEHPIVSKQ